MAQAAAWKRKGPAKLADGRRVCPWCVAGDDYVRYHDREWGRPVRDDRRLFELLCLEGAQAGLSWLTILRKREGYRMAFAGFDARRMARFDARRRQALMRDERIVRNRLKIEAFVANARALLRVQEEGSFRALVWGFAPRGRRRRPRVLGDIPSSTPESDAMSRELKRRGFRFVGTTICYAFMQAAGMIDDHLAGCHAIRRR
jgi:DNA-3-methyladenine glycosylase I